MGTVVVLGLSAGCTSYCGTKDDESAREAAEKRVEVVALVSQLEKRPDDAALLNRLGLAYWGLGELDNAEREFRRALTVSDDSELRARLGALLYSRGRYVAAANTVTSLHLDASSPYAHWRGEFVKRFDEYQAGAAAARQRLGEKVDTDSLRLLFISVPGGTFVRGDSDVNDARPPRQITVSSYSISQYEVTTGQFRRFLDETGYQFESFAQTRSPSSADDYPAAAISWLDAEAFTIWLSGREHAVYRLPTEAEWELAARGFQGYREPWGNQRGRSQVDGNWGQSTLLPWNSSNPPVRPVGSFDRDRSPFGVFDMAGNVREWCLDEYSESYYAWSPSQNPFGPVTHSGLRVLRGGAWNDPGPGDFALIRSKAGESQRYTGFGFRIVREQNSSRP